MGKSASAADPKNTSCSTSLHAEKFWELLQQSGLLTPDKLDSVRARIEKKQAIASSSTKIARLLVANKLLTEPQARRLLSGKRIRSQNKRPDIVQAPSPAAPASDRSPPSIAMTAARRKQRSKLPLVLSICLLVLLLITGSLWFLSWPRDSQPTENTSTTATSKKESPADEDEPHEFTDSTDALWGRSKPGEPIQTKYAPAGVQAIFVLRLADLMAHPEGAKIIRSVGPDLESLLGRWLQRVGLQRNSIERLSIHLLAQCSTIPGFVVVAELFAHENHESLPAFSKIDQNRISRLATDSIWFPKATSNIFVFGPTKLVNSLKLQVESGQPTNLRRELEQLRLQSHDTDQMTILVNPNFLRDEAQGLFPNTRQRLLEGLYDFWSEDAQAVSFGLQLTDTAIAEARMIAREDLPPRRFAGQVKTKLRELPSTISDLLGRMELDSHWQPLALRFPSMVRFATDHTRVQTDGREVAVSTALPAGAVHNLVLASELSLASPLRKHESNDSEEHSTWDLAQVLATKTSVRFSQNSLDFSMRDIVQQIRDEFTDLPFQFTIEVIGTDLEPEGITRNQQIRDFDETNQTLSDILTTLVMKANPTQNVLSAADPEQKLVWVPVPDSTGKILITTRNAARKKALMLPPIFRQ